MFRMAEGMQSRVHVQSNSSAEFMGWRRTICSSAWLCRLSRLPLMGAEETSMVLCWVMAAIVLCVSQGSGLWIVSALTLCALHVPPRVGLHQNRHYHMGAATFSSCCIQKGPMSWTPRFSYYDMTSRQLKDSWSLGNGIQSDSDGNSPTTPYN